jgi:citrate lyase subunit beta/citryl-CoA lyase
MRPARSLLFIPGNRKDWIETADDHGADVVVLDLEDSVPRGEKDKARELVAEAIPELTDRGQRVHVRVNGHPNNHNNRAFHKDIEAVANESVEAFVLAEVDMPEDVVKTDTLLTHIERCEDLPIGGIELNAPIETAPSMRHVYEICQASDRVATIGNGAVKGTDTNRALKFEWTGPGREGLETLHMRQKALLDARAAGIDYPLAGTYVDVDDIEGLRKDMQFSREMGFSGYTVIHPSHVEHANEIFSPDEETIEYWIDVRQALLDAKEEGKSAIRYEGDMIDTANIKTAEQYLEMAKEFEDDLDIDIEVD